MRAEDINPGDVFTTPLNSKKKRPWLVLWVDDDSKMVALAALSRTALGGKNGVRLPDDENSFLTSWTMIWPAAALDQENRTHERRFSSAQMEKLRGEIRHMLDL